MSINTTPNKQKNQIINQEIINSILQTKLKTTNYELIKYSCDAIEEKIGFLGEYYKLKISVKVAKEEEEYYFFVKVVPRTGFSDFVTTSGSFSNEIFMYEKVFPKMGTEIYECVPRCFYSKENEIIVFEDLNKLNFKVANKHEPFGYQEISLLLKKLAKFHACSLVLEEELSRKGKMFRIDKEFVCCVKETNYVKIDKHLGYEAVNSAVKGLLKMVDKFPAPESTITDEELKAMIPRFYERIMYEQCAPSKKYRNVFCHGDLWANNIMLKYDDTHSILDCHFLDFQNVRICPPAHDVLSCIYLTTSRALRQKYFTELLHFYHDELITNLTNQGCQFPENIISLKDFLASCDELKIFAINFAVTMFPIVNLPSEGMEELFLDNKLTEFVMFEDRGDFICGVCDRDDRYKKLLMDSLMDLRELCGNIKITAQLNNEYQLWC